MIKVPLTNQVKSIVSQMMAHPVFSSVIADYQINQYYLFIPETRINDRNELMKLIRKENLMLADR